eukprot:CAMPEP_0170550042 /NCGR_PEP_ID=MMETSP0211-20121228/8082_1 /TAXON_ID=311385 /ORGANISM="Pseudokeronopsis sp., Strain OXSARD2" /LENGTH=98 /DNA_ID=CAMNT_0010856313 /DNA_START=1564 /DNA_END=1863 /DNA_ORIENTATION=-
MRYMKKIIQDLTNTLSKVKDEKEVYKKAVLFQGKINPSEYEDMLLEKNRDQEKILTLEQVNEQLTDVLHKEEKFHQLKNIFQDLNNILVSKGNIEITT